MNAHFDRDRLLQLLILNKEFLINLGHQTVLIAFLVYLYATRCTYQSNGIVRPQGCGLVASLLPGHKQFSKPYHLEEGEVSTRFL